MRSSSIRLYMLCLAVVYQGARKKPIQASQSDSRSDS